LRSARQTQALTGERSRQSRCHGDRSHCLTSLSALLLPSLSFEVALTQKGACFDYAQFHFDHYSRAHTWSFDSGVVVPATAAPAFHGDPERVDPEEAFVASLSSCHMLTFLAIAARKRFIVEQYRDEALGVLSKNEHGKLWMSHVSLRPKVVFSGEKRPADTEIAAMHHSAHENCFIALSVRSEVTVEPQ